MTPEKTTQIKTLYDTRCYFNVRSKADISQEPRTKVKNREKKLQSKKEYAQ